MASEVVVMISDDHSKATESVDSPQKMSCSSPKIDRLRPSPNIPQKNPSTRTLSRRNSVVRSVSSKPRSRFGEPPIIEENGTLIIPKEFLGKNLRIRVDEEEKNCEKVMNSNIEWVMVECVLLLCILGFMVASLTVHKLQEYTVWGLEIWKWCVLVTVAFFGLLITNWFMEVVLMIRRKYFYTKKAFYFVPTLRSSFQVFVWLSLVLATWVLLFHCGVVDTTSTTTSRVLKYYITRTLIILPIGALLWLSKTMMFKILASSFYATTRFDRIQESIFHQYILQKLSGPRGTVKSNEILRFQITKKKRGNEKKEKLKEMDMNKFYKLKQEGVSAGTMIKFVEIIQSSRLTATIPKEPKQSVYDEKDEKIDTIPKEPKQSVDDAQGEKIDTEITNEREAFAAGYHIFQNVAKRGHNDICEEDLKEFLTLKEMDKVFPLPDGATEIEPIGEKAFIIDWVVKVFKDRQALVYSLDDTKTAVRQLCRVASGILIIAMIIVWLLLVEIATIKVLFLLLSQLLVVAIIFGNSCKTIFEALMFIFIMHPFDVGDRCVIDGVEMIVEEMNILTTVFLRFDNEKLYYPNSVLAAKAISNFYRSPHMGDSFEFSIDFTTPLQKIAELKEKIKKYLEENPHFWHSNHSVVVKDIKNVNKIKMALNFTHTMNFQNCGEKNKRKSELVLEMKKIFEDLKIKYNLLPKEVHLVN